jgi:hypothetical protein
MLGLILATYITIGAIIDEVPTRRTYCPIDEAAIAVQGVDGCGMDRDYTRSCDKHGEKKLESSWHNLYEHHWLCQSCLCIWCSGRTLQFEMNYEIRVEDQDRMIQMRFSLERCIVRLRNNINEVEMSKDHSM